MNNEFERKSSRRLGRSSYASIGASFHGRPAPGFHLGGSTSGFQIEGATKEDSRGPSTWDVHCQAGEIKNHDTGDVACDHYHRATGRMSCVQAYRFPVAWPRVLPQSRGPANEPGFAFYDWLIDELLTANIEPGCACIIWIFRRLSRILADG